MSLKKNAAARQVERFRDLARQVVRHHFGSSRARLEYHSAGHSNFVFEARHPEGEFIVRISPEKANLDTFIKEQWAERAARSAGVPTAELLEVGSSVIPYPFAVSRKVEGIGGIDHPARPKVVAELGRIAVKINRIRTHGFGETFDWSANKLSRNRTLSDYLENEYDYDAKIDTLERSRICPVKTIRAVRSAFRRMSSLKVRPTLNHGDLRLKNVIADEDGRIRAVLDWEKATSNFAPAWELSVALHDLGVDHQQLFVEGYGIKPKRLADLSPYIKAFNLLNYASTVDTAVADKDKQALDRLRQRFAGVFDLYTL